LARLARVGSRVCSRLTSKSWLNYRFWHEITQFLECSLTFFSVEITTVVFIRLTKSE